MRLWHQDLIPFLPRQQLLGQHRECCALRGKGWNRKHATVDYVFRHEPERLIEYHYLVMSEMIKRGYNITDEWLSSSYRGKILQYDWDFVSASKIRPLNEIKDKIYKEHNNSYLIECLNNLHKKGVILTKMAKD